MPTTNIPIALQPRRFTGQAYRAPRAPRIQTKGYTTNILSWAESHVDFRVKMDKQLNTSVGNKPSLSAPRHRYNAKDYWLAPSLNDCSDLNTDFPAGLGTEDVEPAKRA
jgi:hypothetical protein